MWALVKADIYSSRTGLFVIGVFVTGLFVLHAVANGWNFNSFVHATSTSAVIGIGFIAVSMDKERRDRTMASLPLSITDVGVARLAYVLVIFAALAPVWVAFLLASSKDIAVSDLWTMINAAAMSTIIYLLFAIHQDIGHFHRRRYRRLFYAFFALFLATLALLGLLQVLDTWGPKYGEFFATFPAVVIHTLIAAGLFVLDLRIFVRRTSYLS